MSRPAPVLSEAMQSLVSRALNSERGIEVRFPDKGAATNFRQRYYSVRKHITAGKPDSEWRTLTCVIVEHDGAWWVQLIPNDQHVLDYEIKEL